MSETPFLKCPCQNCGGPIEFPAQGVGLKIECPHCGQRTVLTGPAPQAALTSPAAPAVSPPQRPVPQSVPAPRPKSAKPKLLALVAALFVLGSMAGGALWYSRMGPGSKRGEAVSAGNPSTPIPTSATHEASPKDTTSTASELKNDKSIDDLKPGAVTLEKAKSGSLVYAVGRVKNDSAHERFGVRVQIELTDAKGRPAGKAGDYTQIIEPGQEWRFRALVLDSKATGGKVVSIKED